MTYAFEMLTVQGQWERSRLGNTSTFTGIETVFVAWLNQDKNCGVNYYYRIVEVETGIVVAGWYNRERYI